MPDPDLGPVVIGDDLLQHLQSTLGVLPDQEIDMLAKEYGLTVKDAMSLISLNEGGTVEYFYRVMDELHLLTPVVEMAEKKTFGRLAGNWVLHEMGGLTHDLADEIPSE